MGSFKETLKTFIEGLKSYYCSLSSSPGRIEKPEDRRLINLILIISAVMFLLRTIRIFSYPMELMGDEIHDVLFAAWRYTGKVGFFYTDFSFAPGNMHHQIMSLFTGLIKEHVEYYKLFAMFYSGLFILGLYLFTKELFDKKTAALAVFMMCVSYTGFFNSRLNLCNNLVPVFMIFSLYFLVMALKKDIKYAAPYFTVFILGFNTYYNFALIIPVIVWFAADNFLSGKTQRKKFVFLVIVTAVLAGVLYALYCWKGFMPKWSIENMEGAKAGGSIIMDRLDNIKYLFFKGHPRADQYMTDLPFINLQEMFLLTAGLVVCALCIRMTEYKLLVVSLIVFLTAAVVVPTTHQMRLIQAAIPISILTALPAGYLFQKNAKAGFAVMGIISILYIGFISHYFTDWEKQLFRNDTNKRFALYLNDTYGDKAVYFENIDFEVPFFTSLRLKGYYEKNEKKYGAFKINGYWLPDFMDFIGRYYADEKKLIDIKVYDGRAIGRYPFALISFPLNSKFGMAAAADEAELMTYNESKGSYPIESALKTDGKHVMRNTLIKELLAYRANADQKPEEVLKHYTRTDYPFWDTADFNNKVSKLAGGLGDAVLSEKQRKLYEIKKVRFFTILDNQMKSYVLDTRAVKKNK